MSKFSYIKKIIKHHFARKEPVYITKLQSELLEGRSALITGGTYGIGYSIAEAFLASGAEVTITGRSQQRLGEAVGSLACGCDNADRVHGIVMDNTTVGSLESRLTQIVSNTQSGMIDVLVNNAGILRGGAFGEVAEKDFDDVLDTNLKGTYFISQVVARYMDKNGIRGNILNIASSSSLRPATSPYTLSKWGIRGLTEGLAKTLVPLGIVVNGLAPGPTATPMLLGDDIDNLENSVVPVGRYAAPEEIANMAVVLVSSMGRMVVGDTVYMTGGSGVITYDDMSYEFPPCS